MNGVKLRAPGLRMQQQERNILLQLVLDNIQNLLLTTDVSFECFGVVQK